jgi:hypothetical protein
LSPRKNSAMPEANKILFLNLIDKVGNDWGVIQTDCAPKFIEVEFATNTWSGIYDFCERIEAETGQLCKPVTIRNINIQQPEGWYN